MANIEVFIAGTYLCEDIVKQVNELACSKCDAVIYDLHQSSATAEWIDIAKRYGVQSVPCVALNGKRFDVEKVKKAKVDGVLKTHAQAQE